MIFSKAKPAPFNTSASAPMPPRSSVEAPSIPTAQESKPKFVSTADQLSSLMTNEQPLANLATNEQPDKRESYGKSLNKKQDDLLKDESGQEYVYTNSLVELNFADLWYSPEKIAYIRDKRTKFALIPLKSPDLDAFHNILEQGYTGSSSYAATFKGQSYRIERINTLTGPQYNCRKMPTETPDIHTLGLPEHIVEHLLSLANSSGLILFAGPTGMGKTTTMSALTSSFLKTHGGFLYTIEDPPEMPLDGVYHAKNGGLGLCKQTPVEFDRWEDGLKSALRSKPRYILIGEIRTPEVASQALRAATSGHLVVSSIHANSVEDALNSIIKYAAGSGLDEKLVSDLLARGVLAVIHQVLDGTTELHPVLHTIFANPDPLASDQLRMAIRENKISLGTLMETQEIRLRQGKSMFNKYV